MKNNNSELRAKPSLNRLILACYCAFSKQETSTPQIALTIVLFAKVYDQSLLSAALFVFLVCLIYYIGVIAYYYLLLLIRRTFTVDTYTKETIKFNPKEYEPAIKNTKLSKWSKMD